MAAMTPRKNKEFSQLLVVYWLHHWQWLACNGRRGWILDIKYRDTCQKHRHDYTCSGLSLSSFPAYKLVIFYYDSIYFYTSAQDLHQSTLWYHCRPTLQQVRRLFRTHHGPIQLQVQPTLSMATDRIFVRPCTCPSLHQGQQWPDRLGREWRLFTEK